MRLDTIKRAIKRRDAKTQRKTRLMEILCVFASLRLIVLKLIDNRIEALLVRTNWTVVNPICPLTI